MKDLKSYITESKKDYFKALCKLNTKDFEKVTLNTKNDEYIQDNMFKELDILIDDVVWMMQDACEVHGSNQDVIDIVGDEDWLSPYIYETILELELEGNMSFHKRIADVIAGEFKKIMKVK